jgi:DNA-binding NarL/FixJ family response regulator
MGAHREGSILLVGDDPGLGAAKSLLQARGFTVESFRTAGEARERLRIRHKPLVWAMVLDLDMPNGLDEELISDAHTAASDAFVVALSGSSEAARAVFLLRRRIPSLIKPVSAGLLVDMLADVSLLLRSPHHVETSTQKPRTSRIELTVRDLNERVRLCLTAQERNVLQYLKRGMANKEIALELGCSAKTVEFHLTNMFRKTGAASRLELVMTLQTALPAARGGNQAK